MNSQRRRTAFRSHVLARTQVQRCLPTFHPRPESTPACARRAAPVRAAYCPIPYRCLSPHTKRQPHSQASLFPHPARVGESNYRHPSRRRPISNHLPHSGRPLVGTLPCAHAALQFAATFLARRGAIAGLPSPGCSFLARKGTILIWHDFLFASIRVYLRLRLFLIPYRTPVAEPFGGFVEARHFFGGQAIAGYAEQIV